MRASRGEVESAAGPDLRGAWVRSWGMLGMGVLVGVNSRYFPVNHD